jgi:hypothetical protein
MQIEQLEWEPNLWQHILLDPPPRTNEEGFDLRVRIHEGARNREAGI